jgi:two-component system, LytTR family, response regulator
MKHKALIIDDEYHIREGMQVLLAQNCPNLQLVGAAESAQQARGILERYEVDILFLDISMPGEDGFSFLKSIEAEKYAIIFVTAFQEYALKAFKASAVDYLLKPVNAIELKEAVAKSIALLQARSARPQRQAVYAESLANLTQSISQAGHAIQKITVPEQFGFKIVDVDKIMYLEADSNYTIIHFSGFEKLVATRSLGDFEKILDESGFFRIHKSYIINLNFLHAYSSFEGNFAELHDGTKLSISRRKLNDFREEVSHFAKIIK